MQQGSRLGNRVEVSAPHATSRFWLLAWPLRVRISLCTETAHDEEKNRIPLCTEKQARASKYINPLMTKSAEPCV